MAADIKLGSLFDGIGVFPLAAGSFLPYQRHRHRLQLYRVPRLLADVQPSVRAGRQQIRGPPAPPCTGALGRGGQHRAGARAGEAGGRHPVKGSEHDFILPGHEPAHGRRGIVLLGMNLIPLLADLF